MPRREENMKIAVLGGGGNAHTMAAEFALAGFSVNLCDLPRFGKKIEHVMKTGEIEKIGSVGTTSHTGKAKLNKVTVDVREGIKGVDVIVIAVPAYEQMEFFEAIIANLEDHQTIIIIPGNWGALRLFNLLKRQKVTARVRIAETDRCMFICRIGESWLGAGKARVILERDSLQIAAIPAEDTEWVQDKLKILYPRLLPAACVLETSLNNSNLITHGPIVMMNTGWLEHTRGQFMIYRDGGTPSIGRVVDAVARERDSVLARFGIKAMPREPFYDAVKKAQWVHDPCEVGPPSLDHRYITEDIPYGLVPMALLGHLFGISTPVSDAIVELASTAMNRDFWQEGLTLKELGLEGLRPEEILKVVT
jgi:opine dehydrogenase